MRDISIHAPPRGATCAIRTNVRKLKFQFTPLREGRRKRNAPDRCTRLISIHAPPRGATCDGFFCRAFCRFQFTPLREGRRQQALHRVVQVFISIHAPPRGATSAILGDFQRMLISIHAPPRGATRPASFPLRMSGTFQFTPLREGRL